MHRILSCAHTLRRDQESGTQVRVEIGMWKKLIKGWTVSFEVWSEAASWTEERRTASKRCRQTGRHWYWGRKADLGSGNPRAQRSGADGKAHKKKKRRRREN